MFSVPNKLPAESPKLCSYTCGAQCKGRACPALSCRTRKSDGLFDSFFLNSEPDTILRDSRSASPVCLSPVQDALPQEPDPSQNQGGCLQPQHTGGRARQLPGRSWLLLRWGMLQEDSSGNFPAHI